MNIFEELTRVLNERKSADADESYVASLYAAGTNKILEKVGEEATEVIIAGKDAAGDAKHNQELVNEVADLWFHSMVLLTHLELSPNQVVDELDRRFGIGGHAEKAQRK